MVDFAVDSLLLLLAPMAPHITAELWEKRRPGTGTVHEQPWPIADPAMVAVDEVTMVVQVNGKVKDRVSVDPAITAEDAQGVAMSSPKVLEAMAAAGVSEPRRVVSRPPGLVNIVI